MNANASVNANTGAPSAIADAGSQYQNLNGKI